MPVSYPAHQALVIPLKRRWPGYFDGTALCIGAAAPDAAFAVGGSVAGDSHHLHGAVAFALPVTLLVVAALRLGLVRVISAHLPDLGPLRIRSYGVLADRSHPVLVTVASASIGVGSHLLVDAVTHEGRWASDLLGLERWSIVGPGGSVSVAHALQVVGHLAGTAVTVALLLGMARDRSLERWYGDERVGAVRATRPGSVARVGFWTVTGGVLLVGTVRHLDAGRPLVTALVPLTPLALLVAGGAVLLLEEALRLVGRGAERRLRA